MFISDSLLQRNPRRFFHPLELCCVHFIQMPFYTGCCIYTPGQAFSTEIIFLFHVYMVQSCVFLQFVYSSVHLSVMFPSQAKGQSFTKTILSSFLYLNVDFWTLTKRGNSLIIFSVYFCTNLYQKWGCHQSVCSLQIPLYWIS